MPPAAPVVGSCATVPISALSQPLAWAAGWTMASRYLREAGQIVGVWSLNKQKGNFICSGQVFFHKAHQPCNLGWMLRKARDPARVVGF